MGKTFWDDQEPFRDGPQLVNGKWQEQETYTPAPDTVVRAAKVKEAQAIAAAQQQEEHFDVEELIEQASEEDEDDFTEVLSDARLRLEQGKLYEQIMNHNLFEGVDADPRAASSVQRQVRKFAKEQMEIMLGMRQIQNTSTNVVSSPFSPLEAKALKDIANQLIVSKKMKEEDLEEESAPVAQPKKKALNSIGVTKPQAKPKPISKPANTQTLQKAADPIQRKPAQKRELPPEFEPDYEPLNKPIHEMTPAELAERDRQALERQKNRKSALPADRVPMPSFQESEMLALSQVSRAVGSPSRGNLSAMIMANLKGVGKI